MNILLNNKVEVLSSELTLDELIEIKGITDKYFAVEVNQQVVPKSNYSKYSIKDGDKIEIITAIGGG